jgi:predicted enzyme related to lactoylglutathione lyase
MPNPVVHFEIAGKNGQQLQDFYTKLFGWKVNSGNSTNYGLVDTGAKTGINGGIMSTQGEMPSYITFYIQVDDLQAYLDRAANLGGKSMVPPTPIPGMGSFAMFTDPEGHLVGLFKSS